jgi:hypothetical protein
MEPIKRRGFAQPDRAAAEASVAAAVEADPEPYIQAYLADHRSFGGRYIAADLFKETFEVYRASKDSRNRYNTPVHNTAAVLAAEQLRRMLTDTSQPERDLVVFLTGIPGAGKTSSIASAKELPPHYRAVFEEQLSNLETTRDKLDQVERAGLTPLLIVAHATPENALDNTIKRFYEIGRGASIHVMSAIQGGLPATLAEIHRQFGERVALSIQDNRDRSNPQTLLGWEHLAILESEGNHAEIKHRLQAALDRRYAGGAISDCCYQQAIGGIPIGRDESLAGTDQQKHEADVGRRGISPDDSQGSVLGNSETSARRKD